MMTWSEPEIEVQDLAISHALIREFSFFVKVYSGLNVELLLDMSIHGLRMKNHQIGA
jgi:hypothetical protein